MRTLTDTEILSARRQLQAMAIAAKDAVAEPKRRQERLQRRRGAAA